MNEQIKRFYNERFAQNKLAHPKDSRKDIEKARIFKKIIGEDKKILELGPDRGQTLKFYAPVNSVFCADISSEVLEYVKDHEWCEGVLCFDFNDKFPVSGGFYDVVVAGDVIEHVFSPENLVKESFRVLKVGGLFVGSTPNSFNWRVRVATLLNIQKIGWDNEHIRFFNDKLLARLLGESFHDVRIIGYHGAWGGKLLPSLFAEQFIWVCKKR